MFWHLKNAVLRVPTFKSIKIAQPLSLMHVSMERKWLTLEKGEDGHEPTDTVLAVGEDDGAPGVAQQEVVDIQVLLIGLRAVYAGLCEGASSPALLRQVDHFRSFLHPNLCRQHFYVQRLGKLSDQNDFTTVT